MPGGNSGYFPFFVDIAGKSGVIVGGGKVAARKLEKLLPFGPGLTVIAPHTEECVRAWEKSADKDRALSCRFVERELEPADLEGADFVIAATDDEAQNGRISDLCKERRILVNVVDDKEKCTFLFPALVREKDLTIGISTGGKSPAAASWIRKETKRALAPGIGDVIDLMGQIRPKVMELEASQKERKDILESLFLYCVEREGKVMLEELERRLYEKNPNRNKGQ